MCQLLNRFIILFLRTLGLAGGTVLGSRGGDMGGVQTTLNPFQDFINYAGTC